MKSVLAIATHKGGKQLTVLDEIRKRHAERAGIIEESRKMKPPVLTDDESVKEHIKLIKNQQGALIDACFMVDRDVQVVIGALYEASAGSLELMEAYVNNAYGQQRLTAAEHEVLSRRELAEAEAREKEAKSRGEVKGQMKLIKDDGSVAQEASAVTTRRVEQ